MQFIEALVPLTAILATAWVLVTLIRPKAPAADPGEAAANLRLSHENQELKDGMRRLEERLCVLERIATDPAARTAREIEELR